MLRTLIDFVKSLHLADKWSKYERVCGNSEEVTLTGFTCSRRWRIITNRLF